MEKILSKIEFGDMQAIYLLNEGNQSPELILLPADMEYREQEREKNYPDSLIQIKIAGDVYQGGYAGGITMRQGGTVAAFKYEYQDIKEDEQGKEICTVLKDARNYKIEHHLVWKKEDESVRSFAVFYNEGPQEAQLELFSSFSLGKISPFLEKDQYDSIVLYRLRSVWSMEGRLESRTLEELQLEPSWAGHAVRAERYGQAGSMPVNGYFPCLVLEDKKNQIFWGAQIAHNASWQMEVYRKGDCVQISGGLADRELGHWLKTVKPGENFTTPQAILSVCRADNSEVIFQRLTSALEKAVDAGPESEQELPIIFNEYCTTWGNPSHENIKEIVETIKDKGFSYFVIDCGWYKQKDIPWDISMGDYEISKELFPEGLEKTVSFIKENGMKPGIWFEIENVGEKAKAYKKEEYLLHRDGKVLTTTMRRFWDMRQPFVQEYLTEKVIGTLKKYGFEYMKIDYNDTIGIGCDGAESLGEGLRQNMSAALAFIRKVKGQMPDIILENCASGGHRLEPLMMSECSMASFSDAHECLEIPIIAANLHRAILPRQSQIWAVIRKEDSLQRIAYSIAATFLGRMCISGDVCQLNSKQWELIDAGIKFYKKIAPIIKKGFTLRYGTEISSYRNPRGWQGIVRYGKGTQAYAVFHAFHGIAGAEVSIPLIKDYEIAEVYSCEEERLYIKDKKLTVMLKNDKMAVAVLLKQK